MEAMDFIVSTWFLAVLLIITIITITIKNRVYGNIKYEGLKICKNIYGEELGSYKYLEFKEIFLKIKIQDSNKIHMQCDTTLVILNNSTSLPGIKILEPLMDLLIQRRMHMEVMRLRKAMSNVDTLNSAISLVELFFLLSSNSKDSANLARLKHIRSLWRDKKK